MDKGPVSFTKYTLWETFPHCFVAVIVFVFSFLNFVLCCYFVALDMIFITSLNTCTNGSTLFPFFPFIVKTKMVDKNDKMNQLFLGTLRSPHISLYLRNDWEKVWGGEDGIVPWKSVTTCNGSDLEKQNIYCLWFLMTW